MKHRLPYLLSATALVVAVLGATPLGQAAGRLVRAVPPFASRAGYADKAGFAKHAKLADVATNAKLVVGHRISANPLAGDIPVVGTDGKLPASIGAVGPAGPAGPAGAAGAQGSRGPSDGYSTLNDARTNLSFNFGQGGTEAAHLDVPAGSYLIFAKADLGHTDDTHTIFEGCFLKAETDADRNDAYMVVGQPDTVVPYQLAHTFTAAGAISFSCYLGGITGGDTGYVQHVKLSAIRLGSLH